jgi:hypothetical protein
MIGLFVITSTLVSYKVSNKHRFEAEGGEERPCSWAELESGETGR